MSLTNNQVGGLYTRKLMNEKIKTLMEEVRFLEKEKEKRKEEVIAKIKEIAGEIMEYRTAFEAKNLNNRYAEDVSEIVNNQKIVLKFLSYGAIRSVIFNKNIAKGGQWYPVAEIKFFFHNLEDIEDMYKYEIIKEEEASYRDIIVLAQKTLEIISRPDGPAEMILNQKIENLKNTIK